MELPFGVHDEAAVNLQCALTCYDYILRHAAAAERADIEVIKRRREEVAQELAARIKFLQGRGPR